MKKRQTLRLPLFFIAMMFIANACVEKIELDIPREFQNKIFIDGRLIKANPSVLEVTIKRIFDFTGNPRNIAVSSVILHDESNNQLVVEEAGVGKYKSVITDNFLIETGKSYKLEINTLDGGHFVSSFEPLLPVPQASGLKAEIIQKEAINALGNFVLKDFVRFSIDTPLKIAGQEDKARLKWSLERAIKLTDTPIDGTEPKVCYITKKAALDKVDVINGNLLQDDILLSQALFDTPPNFDFAEGFYFSVFQESLSEGAYQYWDQISQLIERTGNFFETPAGKIRSNFQDPDNPDEEIFGYFYATSLDTIRLFVSPAFAGNPVFKCPGMPIEGTIPICDDCLIDPDSQTEKPAYWIE